MFDQIRKYANPKGWIIMKARCGFTDYWLNRWHPRVYYVRYRLRDGRVYDAELKVYNDVELLNEKHIGQVKGARTRMKFR